MEGFADLHKLPEDVRIKIIGECALANPGKVIGVPTDNEPGKPERYVEKLKAKFPTLVVSIAARSGLMAVLHVTAPTNAN